MPEHPRTPLIRIEKRAFLLNDARKQLLSREETESYLESLHHRDSEHLHLLISVPFELNHDYLPAERPNRNSCFTLAREHPLCDFYMSGASVRFLRQHLYTLI
jgi:hypothetical protein